MQTSKLNILHSGKNAINLEIVFCFFFFEFVLLLAI